MAKTILVIAAHSDDEALGCGGTMARHAALGDTVHVLFLTDGVGARGDAPPQARARVAAAKNAMEILGAASMTQLDFPDNRIDTVALLDIVQAIEAKAIPLAPDIIYTHHGGDLNVDHRMCHQAVLTAFRPMPGQSVRAIYGFEVASATEWGFGSVSDFVPQRFVDISTTLAKKMAALDAYSDEMRDFPHPRSQEALHALATWRGATVGCAAAEAFSVIRDVID
jgi:N-acetylglucosamine malate deacetylase 1